MTISTKQRATTEAFLKPTHDEFNLINRFTLGDLEDVAKWMGSIKIADLPDKGCVAIYQFHGFLTEMTKEVRDIRESEAQAEWQATLDKTLETKTTETPDEPDQ